MATRSRLHDCSTAPTVCKPDSCNFLMSLTLIPHDCKSSRERSVNAPWLELAEEADADAGRAIEADILLVVVGCGGGGAVL